MEIDSWINGYKVRAFPWVDGENIYVNVQYFAPGQSLCKPPVFDKTAFVLDDEAGRSFVYDFTATTVEYIAGLDIPDGGHANIKVTQAPRILIGGNKNG